MTSTGHAIECRICAEDPADNLMPKVGTIACLGVPDRPYLRLETSLIVGKTVTTDFDPMLARLVVHGDDRGQAIVRSIEALHEPAILGVRTNTDYLIRVLGHAVFRAGDLPTGFPSDHADELLTPDSIRRHSTPC